MSLPPAPVIRKRTFWPSQSDLLSAKQKAINRSCEIGCDPTIVFQTAVGMSLTYYPTDCHSEPCTVVIQYGPESLPLSSLLAYLNYATGSAPFTFSAVLGSNRVTIQPDPCYSFIVNDITGGCCDLSGEGYLGIAALFLHHLGIVIPVGEVQTAAVTGDPLADRTGAYPLIPIKPPSPTKQGTSRTIHLPLPPDGAGILLTAIYVDGDSYDLVLATTASYTFVDLSEGQHTVQIAWQTYYDQGPLSDALTLPAIAC